MANSILWNRSRFLVLVIIEGRKVPGEAGPDSRVGVVPAEARFGPVLITPWPRLLRVPVSSPRPGDRPLGVDDPARGARRDPGAGQLHSAGSMPTDRQM
jgi:hypothetical protein